MTYFGSLEYWGGIHLRNKLLKETSSKEVITDLPFVEKDNWHVVVTCDGEVVGTLMLEEKNQNVAQVKQVAISDCMQGQGLGKMMLQYAEELARKLGFKQLFLTGRESAWAFYYKLNFESDEIMYYDGHVLLREFYKQITCLPHQTNIRQHV